MNRKKLALPLLLLGILFLGITIYCIFNFSPYLTITFLHLPLFPFIMGSFTLSLFCCISFFTRSLIHGLILSGTVLVYLILRLFGLTSLFFLILLIALCVTLELFFFKKS